MDIDFSRPAKPTDNARNESFNGRFREECLDAHWFLSLQESRLGTSTITRRVLNPRCNG
ncbi:integrase core domain-containing protein [Burkholderia sp. F1]|uniref:integrase core domain-containing protein n=1 Tax=Burkholderia sp. F1 TaxID=3366817 RepID=UPI003D73FFFE